MRTTRILLAALSLMLAAACSTDVTPVSPTGKAVRGTGFSGSGNSVATDSTSTMLERCGTGFCGTGN